MDYDTYNREERYLCAHLFRLLHEWVRPGGGDEAFSEFLKGSGVLDPPLDLSGAKIYFEVALIHDSYQARKPDVGAFMDALVHAVALQERVSQYRTFTHIPDVLQDASRTHPRKIRQKAKEEGIPLSASEARVYGALQAIFNAKPDLAVTIPGIVIAYEAKFTEAFVQAQTERTRGIVEIWSSILFNDLGFTRPPTALTAAIGPERLGPDISWEHILELASTTYPPEDRTRTALQYAVRLLAASPLAAPQ